MPSDLAERVEVIARVGGVRVVELLGRDVQERPEHSARTGQSRLIETSTRAEVADDECSVIAQKKVLG
jgi:hypothetical protein